VSDDRYELVIAPTARRQLTEQLPEAVAFAAYEFVVGALLDNLHRVGKRLRPPLDDRHSARRGTYRVIYRIDEERMRVTVVGVLPLQMPTGSASDVAEPTCQERRLSHKWTLAVVSNMVRNDVEPWW
jgi:mRNA-degrading endonuclease RelE of RelBE toxin-antitoxin system